MYFTVSLTGGRTAFKHFCFLAFNWLGGGGGEVIVCHLLGGNFYTRYVCACVCVCVCVCVCLFVYNAHSLSTQLNM